MRHAWWRGRRAAEIYPERGEAAAVFPLHPPEPVLGSTFGRARGGGPPPPTEEEVLCIPLVGRGNG